MAKLDKTRDRLPPRADLPELEISYLLRIMQQQDLPPKKFLDIVLNQAVALSGSRVAYFFYYDEDLKVFSLHAWSQSVRDCCMIRDQDMAFPLDKAGIWAEAIRKRSPVILNNFQEDHPEKRGQPEGHIPLRRFLAIPLFDRDRIVATIGVANKDTDYDNQDTIRLTILMNTVWSILERKRIEEALRIEKELLQTTLFSIADGIIATDQNERIFLINEVAQKLTGWTQREAAGRLFRDVYRIINERTRQPMEDPVHVMLTHATTSRSDQALLISRTGVEHPISDSVAPIRLPDGTISGVVLAFRDVSNERAKQKAIEYLSYHDQLTGLYNRHFFEAEKKRLDTARNLPLAIIMADVNGLKLMNDAYGHAAGDTLLKRAADVLRENCREDDIIARQGGDEFVLLLPHTDLASAENIVRRIREECGKIVIHSESLSISFGVDVKIDPERSIDDVLKHAEDHMYRNKLLESPHMRGSRIQTIIQTLYETHPGEREHADRVSHLSVMLGQALRMSDADLNDLRIVSLLHDIGKINIDSQILNKMGPLTDRELESVRKHPEIGFRILSTINALANLSNLVLSHHERWDGTGYPRGLKGGEIPLASRIIAIAEACDVISVKSGIADPTNDPGVVDEIRRSAGTQFDPELAEVFVRAVLTRPAIA